MHYTWGAFGSDQCIWRTFNVVNRYAKDSECAVSPEKKETNATNFNFSRDKLNLAIQISQSQNILKIQSGCTIQIKVTIEKEKIQVEVSIASERKSHKSRTKGKRSKSRSPKKKGRDLVRKAVWGNLKLGQKQTVEIEKEVTLSFEEGSDPARAGEEVSEAGR